MNYKIAMFDTKPYDEEFFNLINKRYGFNIKYYKNHLNQDTVELTKGSDAVCIFVNDIVNSKIVESFKEYNIKLIALRCAGYNNIDLKAVYKKTHVVRVPAYSPYSVAEHAVALIMGLNRKIHRSYYRTRDGNFSITGLLGFDLHNKTAGVIGTGKIGKCLISILKGFGMKVIAFDAFKDDKFSSEVGLEYVNLETLYKESDIISLHCPLTKETHYIINEDTISQMKDGIMIINTGRGKLIDTRALIKGLKSKKIGSAGLDVYEEESEYFFEDFSSSMINDDVLARLLTFPNVLVTSHQAFFTKEALTNIAETTLQNIKDFFQGEYLKNEICYRCDNSCLKKDKKRCF